MCRQKDERDDDEIKRVGKDKSCVIRETTKEKVNKRWNKIKIYFILYASVLQMEIWKSKLAFRVLCLYLFNPLCLYR